MKSCPRCKENKGLSAFGKHEQTKSGLSSWCRACNCAVALEYRNKNLGAVRAKDRARHHANKDERNAKSRVRGKAYRINNHARLLDKERDYREANRLEIGARSRLWKSENVGKVNADTAARRAAKLQRTPSWADKEAIKFFYECVPAGCEVDHAIPLQGKNISGLHIETNLQWMPALVNSSKGNSFDGV